MGPILWSGRWLRVFFRKRRVIEMGMTYKRGNVWWIKYYSNGKPYRESTRSTKEPDAKRLLKKREGEISEGKIPGIYFDKIRFDELAEDFLVDYRVNEKRSLNRAERSIGHLRKFFGGMRATDITTPKINDYIEKRLGTEAAHATINRELAALKRIFNLGARQTPPKVAHVPYIPMLKENNIRKGFFEYGAFLALRGALPDYLKGFVTFAYKTGWRVSEIANLTWDRVDLQGGIVRIEAGETKNREARTVYLDEELKEILSQQWELRRGGKLVPYVFPNKEGTGRLKDFRGAWDKACAEANLGKRLFHDFRRTAVRDMVRSGIPERVAMMISGHKTRSVFDRYNIVSDADLRLAAEKREAYQRAQMGTVTGTVHDFQRKKASHGLANPS
jgi:integrase